MATRIVRALQKQWVLVAEETCSYQLAGDQSCYAVESQTVPTDPPQGHKAGTQSYKTIWPHHRYNFFPNEGANLYVYPKNNGVVVEVDDEPFYGTVRTIEYAHNAVHQDTFAIANERVTGIDSGAGNEREYLVVAPNDLELHIIFNIICSNGAFVNVYHQPVVTDVGTAITHLRPNLYSAKNIITTYHTPTYTDIGTLKWQTLLPGNAVNIFNLGVGAGARNGEEIVLPAGEQLLISISPLTNNTTVSVANEYYEVAAGANDPA